MKALLIALVALIGSASLVHAKKEADSCETSIYNYGLKKQREDYPGREWKKSQPSDPNVEFVEKKANGFEIWNISYGVDEECLEGYDVLVKRSNDGLRCHVIKETSNSSRDCG